MMSLFVYRAVFDSAAKMVSMTRVYRTAGVEEAWAMAKIDLVENLKFYNFIVEQAMIADGVNGCNIIEYKGNIEIYFDGKLNETIPALTKSD